jgi:hypothetical protein
MSQFRYSAFGLVLEVPFRCDTLAPAPEGDVPDVRVELDDVALQLDDPAASEPGWDLAPGQLLVRGGPRAGRFLVDSDCRIRVQCGPRADDARLETVLLGTVIASVLFRRGLIVLHANALTVNARGVLITGESGAGKSTTTAELMTRSSRLLSDDVVAIQHAPKTGPKVFPGIRRLWLTPDSVTRLGLETPVVPGPRNDKTAIRLSNLPTGEPADLGSVYVLRRTGGAEVTGTRLHGAAKFDQLFAALYGPLLPAQHAPLFAALADIAGHVDVVRIDRPADRWSAHEVAELILAWEG